MDLVQRGCSPHGAQELDSVYTRIRTHVLPPWNLRSSLSTSVFLDMRWGDQLLGMEHNLWLVLSVELGTWEMLINKLY